MNDFKTYLKENRLAQSLKLKDVAMLSNIDQALISKFESGKRMPTDDQLVMLSSVLKLDFKELRKIYLAEKVFILLQDEEMSLESLVIAEARIEYLTSQKATSIVNLDADIQLLVKELDQLRDKWLEVKDIEGIQADKMYEYFSLNYTYESNKIEGNTLTLNETLCVIKDGLTISGKSLNEHLEAINHQEAVDFIYQLATESNVFNKRNVLQLHALILQGINSKYGGRYRDVSVRISGAEHVPPQPYMIDKLMEDYFIFYQNNHNRIHPVILAAEMHERLVTIHPFIDGNGRTSRLIMNLILLSNGYPIAILKGDHQSRIDYFKSLEEVQIDKDPTSFYRLILNALKSSMLEHIELAGG